MSDNFKRLKKRYALRATIVGAALALCCALIVCGVLAVAFKRCEVNFHFALYIAVGAGVAAATSFPFRMLFSYSDVKLAKKLDGQLGLNQKVQTMVEFDGREGVIYDLQRAQTDGALNPDAVGKTLKKKDLSGLLKFLVIPVVALAMLFVGIFVPAKKTQQPITDLPFSVTEYQLASLRRLAVDVRASDMREEAAEGVAAVYEELATSLEEVTLSSEMKRLVAAAVVLSDSIIDGENSYLKIGGALLKAGKDYQAFAYALSDAANSYSGGRLMSMDDVSAKQKTLEESVGGELEKWIKSYVQSLGNSASGTSSAEAAGQAIKTFSSAVTGALEGYVEEGGEDGERIKSESLYKALKDYAEDFGSIGDDASGYASFAGYSDYAERELIKRASACTAAIMTQSYNLIMCDYIRTVIKALFPTATLPDRNTKLEGGAGGDDLPEGGESSSGGAGSGEILYGSDDLVYDPEYGGQKHYNQIYDGEQESMLKRYQNGVLQLISSGASTVEVAEYINLYFDTLSSYQGKEE